MDKKAAVLYIQTAFFIIFNNKWCEGYVVMIGCSFPVQDPKPYVGLWH